MVIHVFKLHFYIVLAVLIVPYKNRLSSLDGYVFPYEPGSCIVEGNGACYVLSGQIDLRGGGIQGTIQRPHMNLPQKAWNTFL